MLKNILKQRQILVRKKIYSTVLGQPKIKITLEERLILVVENEESPLEESQKSTKAKTPWEDQRLAQVFKNISKKPGTNQNQSHLQNQAGGEANLIQKKT